MATLYLSNTGFTNSREALGPIRWTFNTMFECLLVERVAVIGDRVLVYMYEPSRARWFNRFYKALHESGELVVCPNPYTKWTVTPFIKFDGFKSILIHYMKAASVESVTEDFNEFFGGDYVESVDIIPSKGRTGDAYYKVFVHLFQESVATDSIKRFYKDVEEKDISVKLRNNGRYGNLVTKPRKMSQLEAEWEQRSEEMVNELLM
jgi:hypothetical protein